MHGLDAMVVPVQAISRGGSSTWRVEVRVLGPDFHRNTVPCRTGPWSVTDLTFGFQDGHWSMAEITENTVCGSASIRSSPSAVAGAFRLISTGILQDLHARTLQPSGSPSCDWQLYLAVGLLAPVRRGVRRGPRRRCDRR